MTDAGRSRMCPCPCHHDPDHCAVCDNDYADLCHGATDDASGQM